MDIGYKVQIRYVPKISGTDNEAKRKILNRTFSLLQHCGNIDYNSVSVNNQTIHVTLRNIDAFSNNPDIIVNRVITRTLV